MKNKSSFFFTIILSFLILQNLWNTSCLGLEDSVPGCQDKAVIEAYSTQLHIRPLHSKDYLFYQELLSNNKTMEKYAGGGGFSKEKIRLRFDKLIKLWQENNPYSVYVVSKLDNTPIGQIMIEPLDKEVRPLGKDHECELSYIFDHKWWGNGFGSEALKAFMSKILPSVTATYLLNGHKITHVYATARADNEASNKILIKLDFILEEPAKAHGAIRNFYIRSVNDPIKDDSLRTR